MTIFRTTTIKRIEISTHMPSIGSLIRVLPLKCQKCEKAKTIFLSNHGNVANCVALNSIFIARRFHNKIGVTRLKC